MKTTCPVCCYIIAALAIALTLASCEHPVIEDEARGHDPAANVTLTFSPYVQTDFPSAVSGFPADKATRAAAPLADQCSRLSVAVFTTDGTKAKNITQKQTDDGFGTVNLSLSAGTYTVIAIAHSSTEGNATITSTEKVTFASNKVTDTFYYYGKLNVADKPVSKEVQMTRCVAMVRLTMTESLRSDICQLKFYYTGGSSTFNPATGYGCVNSKQTEYRPTAVDGSPVSTYEIFTMPHEDNDALKLTVTALDAAGSTLGEVTMENIPVTRNKITTWTGTLFSGGGGSTEGTMTQNGMALMLDTEWGGTIRYTY